MKNQTNSTHLMYKDVITDVTALLSLTHTCLRKYIFQFPFLQVTPGWLRSPERTLAIIFNRCRFLWAECPVCRPAKSVKAIKGTKANTQISRSGLILFWSMESCSGLPGFFRPHTYVMPTIYILGNNVSSWSARKHHLDKFEFWHSSVLWFTWRDVMKNPQIPMNHFRKMQPD